MTPSTVILVDNNHGSIAYAAWDSINTSVSGACRGLVLLLEFELTLNTRSLQQPRICWQHTRWLDTSHSLYISVTHLLFLTFNLSLYAQSSTAEHQLVLYSWLETPITKQAYNSISLLQFKLSASSITVKNITNYDRDNFTMASPWIPLISSILHSQVSLRSE